MASGSASLLVHHRHGRDRASADCSPGLRITTTFLPSPAPASLYGGGSLQACMERAARVWESLYPHGDTWPLHLTYEWVPAGTGVFAHVVNITYGPASPTTPSRPNSAHVRFDGSVRADGVVFYADPTPEDNAEYPLFASLGVDTLINGSAVPGGCVNVGLVHSGAAAPIASMLDLLTLCMHEIGHPLGWDSGYAGLEDQLQPLGRKKRLPFPVGRVFVTAPRPRVGSVEREGPAATDSTQACRSKWRAIICPLSGAPPTRTRCSWHHTHCWVRA